MTILYERPVDVVTVTGPDAGSFLQSLLSQDLDGVEVGASARALLLQPQGKLIAPMSAVRRPQDAWWLVTDAGGGEALRAGLQRFCIRVDARIADESPAFAALAAPHETTDAVLAGISEDVCVLPGLLGGVDVVGRRDAIDRVRVHGTDVRDADAYEAARIGAGIPRLGVDIDEKTIPQEAFLERDAVSFTKGCFVGQELVCRIDTRGHVNRYLRRLHLDLAAPVGAEIVADDKVVGAITSVAGTDALAMVRREVEPPVPVSVRWPTGATAGRLESD